MPFGKSSDTDISNIHFIEESEYEKGFAKFYEENIKPEIKKYKGIKIVPPSKQRKYIALTLLFNLVVLFSLYKLWPFLDGYFTLVSPIIVISLIIGSWSFAFSKELRFKETIHYKIYTKIFKFFDNVVYDRNGRSSISGYKKFNIIPQYRTYENKNLIQGSYKNVAFSLETLSLEGNKSENFRGYVIELEVKKHFTGKTIIQIDPNSVFQDIVNRYDAAFKLECMERVKLEDPNFERIFDVFSSNQVEARYLLTPSFIQRLVDLNKTLADSGRKLEASFCEKKLLILVRSNLELFQPNLVLDLLKPNVFPESSIFIDDCRIVIKEMNIIFSIIDDLRLNQQTGL